MPERVRRGSARCASIARRRFSRKFERAEITDLGVREGLRRRGIGRALVGAAADWITERGVARVEVRVAAGNREGQAFWRALGYGDLMDVLHRRL